MDFFTKTKVVKLKSHLDKYLAADDDQENTRLSRSGGSTRKALWLIEQVEENNQVIRIRSCHGKYLTCSDEPFLLGTAGKKVTQTIQENMMDSRILWEPIKEGVLVKLKNVGGTYLRANGGSIPWRNSVTHDNYHSGSNYNNWTLWDVENVDVSEKELLNENLSMVSSFSSVSDELLAGGLDIGSSESTEWHMAYSNEETLMGSRSPMELFQTAKTVRLRSIHKSKRYLTADENQETVKLDKAASSDNSIWTIEFVQNADNIIYLKSCYNNYLTASNQPFLLGSAGKKVLQTLPDRPDSSVEWEPIREGRKVKLRTRYGHFLRANGGLPPWRNSVTHDIPHRAATQDFLWDVDVVEIDAKSHDSNQLLSSVPQSDSFASETSSNSTSSSKSTSFSRLESYDSFGALCSPKSSVGDGRVIYFHIADEFGEYDDGEDELGITFKGNDVGELRKKLEEVVRLKNLVVCTKSPLNGKLYPLRLKLPPNNVSMHVVLVPSSSNDKEETDFENKNVLVD